MMMLAKLKTAAVMTVAALMLTTGLGLGIVPAAAGDEPATDTRPAAVAKPVPSSIQTHVAVRLKEHRGSRMDDPTFLRRLSLDVRGTAPPPWR